MTRRDEALEEIWEIRRQISKQFDDDPQKKIEYYQKLERQSGAKIIKASAQVTKVKEL